ncbi:tol-pal system YbgF family protein [Haloferula chungangensis]|uniref:Tol-pal system YbgF family protein n=1 Tax=Haloferula chungangensis TaxID=1048331 RepID=A0ABW2LE87_9BACT
MKWFIYIVLGLAIGGGWLWFMKSGVGEVEQLEAEIDRIEMEGSVEEQEKVPGMREDVESVKGQKTLSGILLAFLTAGLVGIIFVIDVLPAMAHRFTHAVYDSAEMVEDDVMHDARAKLAQGDYEGAIAAFREAAAAEPMNRLPYVEIAKIQRDNLSDPAGAASTLRQAIEGQAWEENDAAYLMFRLAEIHQQNLGDQATAVSILQQVMEQFPETRHSANARAKLHDWGVV